jgi:SAM-dependent methyltransferase
MPGAYQQSVDLLFLRKFIRSPLIQLPFWYAGLERGARVLEAGCASGKFSVCFAMRGCAVTALDFSPTMLQNAAALKEKIEREIGALDISFVEGDLENLTLEPNQFDLVINEGVVEHWLDHDERQNVLANMARVAKPGGAVTIIVPNGAHPWMEYWLAHHPGFLSAPPMVRYAPSRVRDDLAAVRLNDIRTDGIYAWRTLDQFPTSRARQLIGGALQRAIPLPRAWRLKWGVQLIGMGRKPIT